MILHYPLDYNIHLDIKIEEELADILERLGNITLFSEDGKKVYILKEEREGD